MTIRPTLQGRFPRVENGTHDVALGNGTQFQVFMFRELSLCMVFGIFGRGLWQFFYSNNPSYLMEKLNIGQSDAANLCDFLRDQFGSNMPNYGTYDPQLCQPETT